MGGPASVRDLRRGQILEAARAIVAEGGPGALTFGALEERLAFTRGVITYHFKNKDEIVDELLRSAITEIDREAGAAVAQGQTALDRVAAVVGAMVRGFVTRADASSVLVSSWGRVAADPVARRMNADLYRRYRAQSARLIRAGVERGELAPCDVDAMAAVMVGVVLGIATQAYLDGGSVDVEACIAEASRAVVARLAPAAPRRASRARAGRAPDQRQ